MIASIVAVGVAFVLTLGQPGSRVEPITIDGGSDGTETPTEEISGAAATSFSVTTWEESATPTRTQCVADSTPLDGFIGGRVWRSRHESPAAYTSVGLYLAAEIDDSMESGFASSRTNRSPDSRRCRMLMRFGASDAEGRFHFDYLEPGTYIVRAENGPLLSTASAPQKLARGETRGAVDVVFPPQGALVGHILAPGGASFEGLELELTRVGSPSAPYSWRKDKLEDSLVEPIAKDGAYRVGPVQSGLHSVWLSFKHATLDRALAFGSSNPGVLLGEVEIVDGTDTLHDFDLRQEFPGALRVAVHVVRTLATPTLDETRTPEPWVRVEPEFDKPGTFPMNVACRSGVAQLGPLAPGIWRVTVSHYGNRWQYVNPAKAVVSAGKTSTITIEIPLVHGMIRCVDEATSAPLPSTLIVVGSKREFGAPQSQILYVTDEHGDLALDLPQGPYVINAAVLTDKRFQDGQEAFMEWPLRASESPVVRLAAPAITPR